MNKPIDYKQKLTRLLLRRAQGYPYTEKTDEYAVVDGEVTLTRRKVVTKRVQPDADALKMLIDLDGATDITQMTDEELQSEKLRLIALLKQCEEGDTAKNSEHGEKTDGTENKNTADAGKEET